MLTDRLPLGRAGAQRLRGVPTSDFWRSRLSAPGRGARHGTRGQPRVRFASPECEAQRRPLTHTVAPHSHKPTYTLPLTVRPQASIMTSFFTTAEQCAEFMLIHDTQDFLDVSRLAPTEMAYDVDVFFTSKDDVL